MSRPLAQVEALASAGKLVVEVDGRPRLLAWNDGAPRLFGGLCPHRGAPLGDGTVIEKMIVCPWHGSAFSIEGGHRCGGPTRAALDREEVRIEGGHVVLDT